MSPIKYRAHYYQKLIINLFKLLGLVYFIAAGLILIQDLYRYPEKETTLLFISLLSLHRKSTCFLDNRDF